MPHPPAESRPGESDLLLEIALQLGQTLELEGLLSRVVERLTGLLEAERALCAVCDEHGRIQRAVVHNLEWAGPGHPLPVSERLIEQVIREQRPVVVSDASLDEEFQVHKSVRLHGLRLIAGVPVVGRDRVLGVLYVDSRLRATALARVHERIDLMNALARIVATAIENAQLFEEQRFRNMLLGQLVHDLRSPLTVVMASVDLLHLELGEQLTPEVAQMSLDVLAAAQRMQRLIESTLELSRVDAGVRGHQASEVDVGGAIRAQVQTLQAVLRRSDLEVVVEEAQGPSLAWTIPERLGIVVDNLILNALKHADHGSVVTARLELRDDRGPAAAQHRPGDDAVNLFRRVPALVSAEGAPFVEVAIFNRGRSIPAALRSRLFVPWGAGERGQRGDGSRGLGLAIVDQCVRNLGGVVWHDHSAVGGTCFRFTLPTRLRNP